MITLGKLAKPSLALVVLAWAMAGHVAPAAAQSCPFEAMFSSSNDAPKATAKAKAKPRSTEALKSKKKRTLAKSKKPPAKIIPANSNGGSGSGGSGSGGSGGWG